MYHGCACIHGTSFTLLLTANSGMRDEQCSPYWTSVDVTLLARMNMETLPLSVAAFSGSLDILMYLIEERKCSSECPGQWGRSPLHHACLKNGNLAIVKYLVEKHGCDPAGKDEQENTPLNVAAFSGSLDILMYLIEERKCSPGFSGQVGRSPLHGACGKNGNLAMVKYLVEKHGCDPAGKDEQGNTPLNVAAFSGSLDILMYLIEERKCSPECPGYWIKTSAILNLDYPAVVINCTPLIRHNS